MLKPDVLSDKVPAGQSEDHEMDFPAGWTVFKISLMRVKLIIRKGWSWYCYLLSWCWNGFNYLNTKMFMQAHYISLLVKPMYDALIKAPGFVPIASASSPRIKPRPRYRNPERTLWQKQDHRRLGTSERGQGPGFWYNPVINRPGRPGPKAPEGILISAFAFRIKYLASNTNSYREESIVFLVLVASLIKLKGWLLRSWPTFCIDHP